MLEGSNYDENVSDTSVDDRIDAQNSSPIDLELDTTSDQEKIRSDAGNLSGTGSKGIGQGIDCDTEDNSSANKLQMIAVDHRNTTSPSITRLIDDNLKNQIGRRDADFIGNYNAKGTGGDGIDTDPVSTSICEDFPLPPGAPKPENSARLRRYRLNLN